MKQYKNFINGEWVSAVSGDTFTNLNPADTREAVTEYALGGRAEAQFYLSIGSDVKVIGTWQAGGQITQQFPPASLPGRICVALL